MPAKGPRLGQKARVERGDYQCHSHRGTQTVTQIKASSRLTLSHSGQVSSGVQMTRQVHKEVPPHCLPAAPSPRLRAADWVRRFKLQPGRQSVDYNSVAGHVGLPETNARAGMNNGKFRASRFYFPSSYCSEAGGEKEAQYLGCEITSVRSRVDNAATRRGMTGISAVNKRSRSDFNSTRPSGLLNSICACNKG